MECASDEKNDVINHVAVSDEIQESWKWLNGMISHVLELNDELLAQLVIDDRNGKWWWFIREKRTIICSLKVEF